MFGTFRRGSKWWALEASTGSPRTSHAQLSASPSPQGLQSLEVWWNAVNLDFSKTAEQMGLKIIIWTRQRDGG